MSSMVVVRRAIRPKRFTVDFLTPDDQRKWGARKSCRRFKPTPSHCISPISWSATPSPAVVLHGAGIYVHVPAPARYAVYKLIISRHAPEGFAKRDKNLHQAEVLLLALAERRPHDLKVRLGGSL